MSNKATLPQGHIRVEGIIYVDKRLYDAALTQTAEVGQSYQTLIHTLNRQGAEIDGLHAELKGLARQLADTREDAAKARQVLAEHKAAVMAAARGC